MSNDLERPLGQNQSQNPQGAHRGARYAALGIIGVSVIAGSAVLALQGEGFREPVPVVAQSLAPQPIAKPETTEVETASIEKSAKETGSSAAPAGAKIIKVKRDNDITGGIKVRDPSKVTQDPKLAHIPEADLVERTDEGALPVRAADGRRSVDVYARPWSGSRGAKVAIIIGGLGISQTSTQSAIRNLPPEVTLAFAPQGNSLSRWAQAARRDGHEILLQIPMEPFDYPNVNPGRGTLLVDSDSARNLTELRRSLGRITNYTGVVNYMGARFTSDPAVFQPVIDELAKRGLMIVDDGTSARSQTASLMQSAKGAYATGDLVIDAVQDKNEIMKKLDELEASARAQGSAIATGTAFDATVAAVAEWSKEAGKRGVEIVGVSAIANDPEK